ncbi:TIGR04149 family rSAM-modified RiPP [uncultured Sphingobacterium sp.]|uniref:TIGR04149 family rSAM-modified RiPP n=1 Tax=uncultured Sphingobacterium sp. TaxID=182688 RepID=UPI003747F0CB
MRNTKIKLKKMEAIHLSNEDFNNILGGFYASTTGGAASSSSGPSASASACNGKDVDVTKDSDAESD